MAKPSFSASDLIFDLRVKVVQIRSKYGTHPADINALLHGVLDGLSIQESATDQDIFTNYGDEIVTYLKSYEEKVITSLRDLVEMVNKHTFFREVVKVENFEGASTYGTSKSAMYYREGVNMAMSWASRLYYSAISYSIELDEAKRVSLNHIKATKKTIVSEL
ncbi:hypothetical protein A2572_04925 [Candidatus Collierbacteria bacterium RIFOXYD1_FULL_40_9]|uniref:Uncharacterized protein n=1 Tax=Candidatus Collierbacteria bacterium RIFOXYD1_FULL_40_9 TaxID=1817731 RepID=A0A1F5FV16_9BACT|nr:MAG: hypothetical protein A2572_04925 [Candidatus Collierbacteria bacterium RIFOXYD1_FULL_40_9]